VALLYRIIDRKCSVSGLMVAHDDVALFGIYSVIDTEYMPILRRRQSLFFGQSNRVEDQSSSP
jgi:hypothetical protein